MPPRDLVAIRLAALNYEEGRFEGNAERSEMLSLKLCV
jgi:hypothetical protein